MVNDLLAEVQAARDCQAAYERHHERVKELLIQARLEDENLGPGDLERMTDRYLDRATISRITYPAIKDSGRPARKNRKGTDAA